jgi:hypothetical protein
MAHDPSGDVPEGTPVALDHRAAVAACLVVIGAVVIDSRAVSAPVGLEDGPGPATSPSTSA